jgi:hypothetical protein
MTEVQWPIGRTRYTAHGNKTIETIIDGHVKTIISAIRKTNLGVKSIMLAGGFGRDEGSIIQMGPGVYLPANDYDIYVVTDSRISHEIHRELASSLEETLGIRVDIKFINIGRIRDLVPDLFVFELKTASRVLWGRDFRDLIPMRKEQIPLSSGLNTLFIETLGLIERFQPDYFGKVIPKQIAPRLGYVCSKVFVEICTALSLLGGFYEPSFARRADSFQNYYPRIFPELRQVLTDLPARVTFHTNMKLYSLEFAPSNLVELWVDARHALLCTIAYFSSRVLGEPFDRDRQYKLGLRSRLRPLSTFYFAPYVEYAFGSRRVQKLARPFGLVVADWFERYRYLASYYNEFRTLNLRQALQPGSILFRIYFSGLLLLLSFAPAGVDSNALEEVFNLIDPICPGGLVTGDETQNWKVLRSYVLKAFKVYSSSPNSIAF